MRNESHLQVQLKKLEQEICLGNQQTFAKYPTCPQDWINPDCSVTQINQSPYIEDVWLSNQSFYYWVTQFSLWTGEEWCDLCTSCPESTERRNLRTRASWFHPQHWVSECGWLLSVIKSGWDPAGIWVRRWQQKEKIANTYKQIGKRSSAGLQQAVLQACNGRSWLLPIQKDSCPDQERIFLCSVTLTQDIT